MIDVMVSLFPFLKKDPEILEIIIQNGECYIIMSLS